MVAQTGISEGLVEEFLGHLHRRGRGSYMMRSWRLGLTDFSRWLVGVGRPLAEVSRGDIAAYIGEFSAASSTAGRASRVVDLSTGIGFPGGVRRGR